MENKKDDILLINLIKMLEMTARSGLGQMEHPVSKKREVNLDQAKINIDMIEMLKRKTSPSNSDDINKYLKELVSNLQMAYLDVSNKKGDNSEEKEEEGKEDQ